jgi:putative flippase GtrA
MSVFDARLLGRHQLAAVIGTSADFGAMIALVEVARLAPPLATIFGAIVGGFVNFSVSRAWAFRARHRGTIASQAMRYGVVSLGGALLNGALVAVVLSAVAAPYVLVRVAVSIAVSLLYTYPLHTRLVFRVGPA